MIATQWWNMAVPHDRLAQRSSARGYFILRLVLLLPQQCCKGKMPFVSAIITTGIQYWGCHLTKAQTSSKLAKPNRRDLLMLLQELTASYLTIFSPRDTFSIVHKLFQKSNAYTEVAEWCSAASVPA